MNKYSKISIFFIIASGVIYTFERAIVIISWTILRRCVALHGTGSYPTNPNFVIAHTNLFIWFFLIIGIVAFFISLTQRD